jgi:hypothetical protein
MSLVTHILEAQADAEQQLQAITENTTEAFPLEGHPTLTRVEITRDLIAYRLSFFSGDDFVTPETVYPEGLGEALLVYRTDSGFKDLPLEGAATILSGLFEDIRDAKFQALFDAALELGSDQNGGISLYKTMCEPGYINAGQADIKGFLVANWNHVDKELIAWIEEGGDYDSGYWSDEWDTCDECGGLVRNQADSYSWKRYGTCDENGTVCGNCLKKDIPAYLETLEGKSGKAVTLDVDPGQHGYVRVNPEGRHEGFESGWHPGQDDDPKAMAKTLKLNGITRFIWVITGVGQFDVRFTLYIHEEIKDELPRVRELLGIKA